MKKEYKTFNEVCENSGIREAIHYKILEARDKSPLINEILSWGIIYKVNQSSINENYVSSWDNKGKLSDFNPNPNFSR